MEPTKEWVKDLVDEVIADEFASPDLELMWLDEDSGAAQIEAQFEARVKIGAATLNELRDALGLDPFANPAADQPMVLTPTGYVPIDAGGGGGGDETTAKANVQGAPAVRERASFADQTNAFELSRVLGKYGYNPEEARVPKHDTGGGEWTRIAASDDSEETSDAPKPAIRYQKYGDGHHWVPRTVYENKDGLSEVAKKVFDKARSGTLADPTVNVNNAEHIEYNKAVDELFENYLKKNRISPAAMTAEQAQEVVDEVKASPDPRISGLRMKIIRERLRYINVYGIGRGRGDEE